MQEKNLLEMRDAWWKALLFEEQDKLTSVLSSLSSTLMITLVSSLETTQNYLDSQRVSMRSYQQWRSGEIRSALKG